MEQFKNFVNKILYPACLIFTFIIFSFSLMYEIAGLTSSSAYGLTDLILFFAFSIIFAWSLEIFRIKKMSFISALLLNFICYIADVIVVFSILGGKGKFGGMIIIFTFLYVIFAITFSIARKLNSNNSNNKNKEYKKMFK